MSFTFALLHYPIHNASSDFPKSYKEIHITSICEEIHTEIPCWNDFVGITSYNCSININNNSNRINCLMTVSMNLSLDRFEGWS